MTMQHIRDVAGLPEIGRYYWVPTVEAKWFGRRQELPVLGPRHNDKQDLNFDQMHFHVDARFVSELPGALFWENVAASPVTETLFGGSESADLKGPYDRKWLCKRHDSPWQRGFIGRALRHPNWKQHFDRWAGEIAVHDGKGWVCPHRQVALKDQPVADDGVVICPLHNLHICNRSGRVLSRDEIEARCRQANRPPVPGCDPGSAPSGEQGRTP